MGLYKRCDIHALFLAITIDSLQPVQWLSLSGSPPRSTDLYRDHSSYRIGPKESHIVTKYSQLAFSNHTVHLAHPCLMGSSIIEDEVIPLITHDPKKSPSTKRIQMAALMGSDAPTFIAI